MENLPVTNNAWILTKDGKIEDFGTMDTCPENVNGPEMDANGGSVIPSWCDSHTHLVFAESREGEFEDRIKGLSYEEIAQRGGGILNSAEKLRKMDEEQLFEFSWKRLMDVIQLGTGAIEIKSGYGLDMDSELKMLRTIKRLKDKSPVPVKSTFLAAHAVPSEFAENKAGYVDHIINEMLPEVANQGLADYMDVFCEKGYFDLADTEQLLVAGNQYGLKPKIHVNQFNAFGGVGVAVKNGALSVDHLEVLNDDDLEILENTETMVAALPSCSFFLKIPYTPVRELIKAEIPFALATDYNPGSTPSGNMNFVMSLACIYMNLTPNEALAAGTLNGAAAMEMSNELGTIEKGKIANFLITKPVKSLAYLPYNFGSPSIDKVIVNGKEI